MGRENEKAKDGVDVNESSPTLTEEVDALIEQQQTETPKGTNFVIGKSLELPSGEKARYKANVDAIKLVTKSGIEKLSHFL